ncbi:hypothetical protein F0562_031594 [Nyssa sinensis]|uniref:Kin17 KOW domain-containing protein n=1 Tax=Nyssa sinensis TaxID=561372 RepID=A0A5J5ATD1_9ASTE|nr:hypothetical protein F0562_031594 [Nyssa sinensis]
MPVENGEAQASQSVPMPLLKLEDVEKVTFALGSLLKPNGKEKSESSKLVFEDMENNNKSEKVKDSGKSVKSGLVVIDEYVGEIEMFESKHVLRIDQEELETVIPQIGGLVRIVNGAYRGSNERLLIVNTDNFCAKVKIEKGLYVASYMHHLLDLRWFTGHVKAFSGIFPLYVVLDEFSLI